MSNSRLEVCVYATFGRCAGPVRPYAHGGKCERHGPPPQPVPDPERALSALQARAGFKATVGAVAGALIDDRAVASGKRRSSPQAYRDARAREEARKEAERSRR